MAQSLLVDDDVFQALQSLAVPLVDDVNTVLRRVLGLSPGSVDVTGSPPPKAESPNHIRSARLTKSASQKKSGSRKRAPRGSLVPESDYEIPILLALVERGGRAAGREVIDR